MRGQWYRAEAGEAMEHEDLFHASAKSRTGKRGMRFGVGIKTEKIAGWY
jgi:hypothetical protein